VCLLHDVDLLVLEQQKEENPRLNLATAIKKFLERVFAMAAILINYNPNTEDILMECLVFS
jgi:hypothetical protein